MGIDLSSSGRLYGGLPRTRSRADAGSLTAIDYGCPAHVGIDLLRKFGYLPVYRLPRTRGDRPNGTWVNWYVMAAAPHTWG